MVELHDTHQRKVKDGGCHDVGVDEFKDVLEAGLVQQRLPHVLLHLQLLHCLLSPQARAAGSGED